MNDALSKYANLRMVASVLAALLIVALLSGCGRKGPLEPPPGSVVNQGEYESETGDNQSGSQTPDRTFILDGLI